ncbi:uncharacterized protein LOC111868365 isoform X2 [Cryptotermes secundus]|uniref:uncharacterized protein LOC111868365 isoform X2 n=1 Tax=Cryptotermes secundus TaxID=105785 RepID=UPI000CD7D257|nr:uncharacterized protein LOC111868365 isoform X2 [Cryptotermes secundus]
MECPPTCSAWCDDNGLLMTSDSISSESCACQGTMELQESDSEEKSSSQDDYTNGMCGENFNTVKKGPGWPTVEKQAQHSPESISADDCGVHLLIPWMEKFASRLVAALLEEALSISCKVTWSIQCSQDCHPADSQQTHQQQEQHTTVSRSVGRWSGPRLCWTPELPPFSSPCNRPGSRSSLASSRLSSSHNSLSVPTANKADDSSFITSAMSHDVLTASEISDMYNVPFDSDIYAVPIDVVRPPRTPQRPKRQQRHHHRKRRRHASSDSQSELDRSTRQHLNLRGKTVTSSQIHVVRPPSHTDAVSESGGVKRHSVPGTSAARQTRSASTESPSVAVGEPIHMTLHEVRQYLQNLYSSSSDSSDNKSKMDVATPKHQYKTVHNNNNNNRNNNRCIVEDVEISSRSVNGNIVTNNVRKNKKNAFVINIKNKKTKDACDVTATKDKDSSVRSEFSEDKEKVKKPPTGRHSFSTNLKQTLCNIFRIRKLPSPDHIAAGEKLDIAGCCVGNGTISTNDSVDVSGKAPFLTRALPPLPATVLLPDGDLDSTPQPSPEDGPMAAEEEEELAEEPSMDFASSIEKVKDYGWYWGPISGEAAEKILSNEPDGSFIVRDSSDDHYIFSLTFKLNGCIRHVRIEHDQGNFSFGSCTKFKSHTIVDFIENAVEHSRSGRYLFFLHRRPVLGPMRVQLLHPVSRFKQVQSLQHMCRFVILKLVRRDLIPSLPLPRRVIDYLSTPHYYSEQLVVEDDLAPSPDDVDMFSFVPQGLS